MAYGCAPFCGGFVFSVDYWRDVIILEIADGIEDSGHFVKLFSLSAVSFFLYAQPINSNALKATLTAYHLAGLYQLL